MRIIVCEAVALSSSVPDGTSTCLYQDTAGGWNITIVRASDGQIIEIESGSVCGDSGRDSVRRAFRSLEVTKVESFILRLGQMNLREICEVVQNHMGTSFEVEVATSAPSFPVPII